MELSHMIVWIGFIAIMLFMVIFALKRMRKIKKARLEAQLNYQRMEEQYRYLKPGTLDTCPRDEVVSAALFHCKRIYDEDFDHYFERFSQPEKVVFGIYQITSTLQGKYPSLHSFFISPDTKPYVPIITDVFDELGAHEISDLMRAARRFAEIIENDEDDDEDDPEMGIYARYNFTDFTNEFLNLVNSTNLNDQVLDYILAHKEDFYDEDIPEQTEERDDVDEGISE